jgi:hypothetical protein
MVVKILKLQKRTATRAVTTLKMRMKMMVMKEKWRRKKRKPVMSLVIT